MLSNNILILLKASFIFIGAVLITSLLLPRLADIASKIGLLDYPNKRKIHYIPKPLVGGLGIMMGIFIVSAWFIHKEYLTGYFIGVSLLFITGFIDDYKELGHRWKFLMQIAASLMFVYLSDIRLLSFGDLLSFGQLNLGNLCVPITIFCTVGVINAINMIDGMDGLSGGVSLAAFVSFAVLAYINNQTELMLLSIAFSGAIIAFLRYNWHPSKLFMGDTGTTTIGFSLCFLSIAITQKDNSHVPPVAPLLILALPIADTVTIMIKRMLQGKNPFRADKYHLHHIMLRVGITKKNTVRLILFLSAGLSSAALLGTVFHLPDYYLFSIFSVYFLAYFIASFYIKDMFKLKVRSEKKRLSMEKRSFIRRPAYYDLEFCFADPLTHCLSAPVNTKGKIVDVSEGGVSFLTEQTLETGQKIIITRNNGTKGIPTHMYVKWIKRVNGKYRVGLERVNKDFKKAHVTNRLYPASDKFFRV